MIVSCRKKYYDDIVRCMADYEFAESKKDKKLHRGVYENSHFNNS